MKVVCSPTSLVLTSSVLWHAVCFSFSQHDHSQSSDRGNYLSVETDSLESIEQLMILNMTLQAADKFGMQLRRNRIEQKRARHGILHNETQYK